ncbi:MAG: outer membrane lipoprotein carrier protein LolA [Bacteroidales bacterium]
MNRLLSFFFFILVISRSLSVAQSAFEPVRNVESFKGKLAQMADSTKTILCDFVQEKYLVVMTEKIVSKGHFWFKRENNIRWEYTSPFKYLIIINNNHLYTSDERNQNKYDLNSNKMLQAINGFIAGCIQGNIVKNKEEYNIEYSENSSLYFVKLVPKSDKMKQMLAEVQIWFDKKDLTVSRLKLVESGGDYTIIDFINKKLNTDIPVEKFSIN